MGKILLSRGSEKTSEKTTHFYYKQTRVRFSWNLNFTSKIEILVRDLGENARSQKELAKTSPLRRESKPIDRIAFSSKHVNFLRYFRVVSQPLLGSRKLPVPVRKLLTG